MYFDPAWALSISHPDSEQEPPRNTISPAGPPETRPALTLLFWASVWFVPRFEREACVNLLMECDRQPVLYGEHTTSFGNRFPDVLRVVFTTVLRLIFTAVLHVIAMPHMFAAKQFPNQSALLYYHAV